MKKDLVIVLAPDSFKESMTAKEVCEAMERGIRKANSQIRCIHVPMADGGEGTMQSLVDATGGRVYSKEVVGPLGNNVVAEYGILGNGEIGVIEMVDFLIQEGCDELQGYYYYKPMEMGKFEELIA